MSEDGGDDPARESGPSLNSPAAAMRLWAGRPRVTRLSRKVLAGGAAVALIAISGALLWALQGNRNRGAGPEEFYSTDHRMTADGLAGLPRDYTGIPRPVPPLGPPLPSDLGRPMLNAGAAPNTVVPVAPSVDPEAQRRAQEVEAARVSRLFASTNIRQPPVVNLPSVAEPDLGGAAALPAPPSSDATFDQNGQDRKLAFVNATPDRRTVSPDRPITADPPGRAPDRHL